MMSEEISQFQAPQNAAVLPDKKYFKIGEASILLGVKPHVLRYWETEFPQIRPYKSKTGQRLYRHRDVLALQHIQKLLYQERYTIAGARQALRAMYDNDALGTDDSVGAEEAFASASDDAPLAVELPTANETRDVLEVVEEKIAVVSQLTDRLENARTHLREIITLLSPTAN